MSITVKEVGVSRTISESVGAQGSASLRYEAWGSDDLAQLETEVLNTAPTVYRGMALHNYSGDPIDKEDHYLFVMNYNTRGVERGGFRRGADTTGGSIQITSARSQTSYSASGETAPDFGTAIDVRGGEPQGTAIIVPALKLSITARIKSDLITSPADYEQTVASVTGYVNNAPILGYAAKELLFAGGVSQDTLEEDPLWDFTFIASPNLSSLSVGPFTGISKDGHDFLWYAFREREDATANTIVQKPVGAYVAKIYGEADMSQLLIGAV